jgi:signal transduction histidine kinase
VRASWNDYRHTPSQMRVYYALVLVSALTLPWVFPLDLTVTVPEWITVLSLVAFSVLNVEISRRLSGGLATTHQPHKALSAWAFASGLLLATPWLLVVVPLTYAHARWRGLRVSLWKWIGSAAYLVLCGYAVAWVRHLVLGDRVNWMDGQGGEGFAVVCLAGLVFLVLEGALFWGSATFNHRQDEIWLRATLTSPGFYLAEAGVLLVGGLLSAVWTGGGWFSLFFVPIYVMIQHAVLLVPLQERAAAAEVLAEKNRSLAALNEDLQEANRFKVDLLGMLGHELGNPLTSVVGFADLGAVSAAGREEAESQRAFELIRRNAWQMRAVLVDILSLVTSERGALTAVPEECLLAERLRHAVAGLHRDEPPVIDCPADLAALVQPGHLDQVLGNLLSNAEKYGGGVVALRAHPTDDGWVEVAVVDHGPGVPAEFREQLFDRYSRDTATAERVIGTGLGLFISRELARANGGDLVHRPGETGGSEFVLRLRGAGSPAVSPSDAPGG